MLLESVPVSIHVCVRFPHDDVPKEIRTRSSVPSKRVTQKFFHLQTIKRIQDRCQVEFFRYGNIKILKADDQVDKDSRQHVSTSSDFNGVSEIKHESHFDSKTKIAGIKIPICKLASLISHIIPDIKSYIPLGSYGCGQKSGKWEINTKLYQKDTHKIHAYNTHTNEIAKVHPPHPSNKNKNNTIHLIRPHQSHKKYKNFTIQYKQSPHHKISTHCPTPSPLSPSLPRSPSHSHSHCQGRSHSPPWRLTIHTPLCVR